MEYLFLFVYFKILMYLSMKEKPERKWVNNNSEIIPSKLKLPIPLWGVEFPLGTTGLEEIIPIIRF